MERQDYIKCICIGRYGIGNHSSPSLFMLGTDMKKEVDRVYSDLGGLLPEAPFRFAKYDVDLEDFIIELDEQEHFNRFRLKTLESSIYKQFNNFNVVEYKSFCRKYEYHCRKHGGFWENASTKKQFSQSEIDGQQGATRWKQRAFYDFVKDAYSITTNVPIIRVSIYETVNGYTINDLIMNHKKEMLLEYIDHRYQISKGL